MNSDQEDALLSVLFDSGWSGLEPITRAMVNRALCRRSNSITINSITYTFSMEKFPDPSSDK